MVVLSWVKAIQNLEEIPSNYTINEDDFYKLHGTEELGAKMQQIQTYSNAKDLNKTFILMELNHHNRSIVETTLCIKVCKM